MGKKEDILLGQQLDYEGEASHSRDIGHGHGNNQMNRDALSLGDGAHNNSNNHIDTIFDQTFTSEPPPYSSSIAYDNSSNIHVNNIHNNNNNTTQPRQAQFHPLIDFTKYSIPDSSLSWDGSAISTYHAPFSSSPAHLVRFIREQAALPPLPYIHVMGEKQPGSTKSDFDIRINVLPLFLGSTNKSYNYMKIVEGDELAYRGKSGKSTVPVVGKGGLDEWARRFCGEKSTTKSFTLTRQLSNWNTDYIDGQIRSLVASTGYNKPITVLFPVKYSKLIVYPPKSGNMINNFFTSLVSPLLDKKRFEVVRAVWPYASLPPGPGVTDADADTGRGGRARVPVVQSEELWWEEWKDVIKWTVMSGRNGWVSIDDVLEYRMAPVAPQLPANPWRW